MTNTLAKTPLAAWHEARGARMVIDFAHSIERLGHDDLVLVVYHRLTVVAPRCPTRSTRASRKAATRAAKEKAGRTVQGSTAYSSSPCVQILIFSPHLSISIPFGL